jgi:hypothetical protein
VELDEGFQRVAEVVELGEEFQRVAEVVELGEGFPRVAEVVELDTTFLDGRSAKFSMLGSSPKQTDTRTLLLAGSWLQPNQPP